ncbi:MAG: ABC transporter substrate-binding protein [Gammaproteobacteria bacterium]
MPLLFASPVRSEDESIRIGYLPMVSSLTHFVATDQKYYEREGVKVNAGRIATSNLIAQELVVGHIDVAIELSIVPLLRLLESKPEAAKLFSLSSITAENGFDAVLVKTSSPARQLCDLGGKRIGVFPGTTARRSLARLFEQRCAAKPAATYGELEPSLQLPALINGDIDALHSYEPTVSLALARDDVRRLHTSVYAAQYTPNPIGVAATNSAFMRKHPAAASKVLRALDSAVVFIRDNPEQARKILANATRVDPTIAASMNLMPMSLVSEADAANLQGYLDLLAEMKETGKQHRARDLLIQRR